MISRTPAMTLALLAFVAISGPALGDLVTYETLSVPGGNTWANFSLSSDGSTMAANVGGEIYLWTQVGGFTDLGFGDDFSSSVGISANGGVVCASRTGSDGYRNPALWSAGTGWIDLGHAGDGCVMDGSWGSGYAVNGDGTIAVGLSWYCPGAQGFRWTAADGVIGLGHPDGASSRASSISADGSSIVGFYEHPEQGFRRPVRWLSDGTADFFAGADSPGEAMDVSSDGSIITGQATPGFSGNAFIYSDGGGLTMLGTLSGSEWDQSIGVAVSDAGRVVGWSGDPFWGGVEAFIWDATGGMRSLRQYLIDGGAQIPDNVVITTVFDISADGSTLVGAWQDLNWNQGYWMARIQEDPTPVFLSEFTATPAAGAVDLTFRIGAAASPSDFELVGAREGAEWIVPLDSELGAFVAHDDSPELLAGGRVEYSLFYLGDGGRDWLRTESVLLDWSAPATSLAGAAPNPFRAQTTIRFSLARAGHVTVSVYDPAGRVIATAADGDYAVGAHEVVWDGRTADGRSAPSGVYLLRLSGEGVRHQTRVTRLD